MGRSFQSPFASPPGKGLSSSKVNVLWGVLNVIVAYLLVARAGNFHPPTTIHVLVFGLGALLISLQLAHHFGQFHGATSHRSSRQVGQHLPFIEKL